MIKLLVVRGSEYCSLAAMSPEISRASKAVMNNENTGRSAHTIRPVFISENTGKVASWDEALSAHAPLSLSGGIVFSVGEKNHHSSFRHRWQTSVGDSKKITL